MLGGEEINQSQVFWTDCWTESLSYGVLRITLGPRVQLTVTILPKEKSIQFLASKTYNCKWLIIFLAYGDSSARGRWESWYLVKRPKYSSWRLIWNEVLLPIFEEFSPSCGIYLVSMTFVLIRYVFMCHVVLPNHSQALSSFFYLSSFLIFLFRSVA